MNRSTRKPLMIVALFLIVLVAVIGVILASQGNSGPDVLELSRVFDDSPTGFTFRYPEDWIYSIPFQNVLISGLPETLNNQDPGPTFTVQRSQPISVMGSLEEALDLYLRRGPLSDARQWEQISDITPTTFLGREALTVDVQGRDNEASPDQHSRIIITTSENTFVYIFVITAPTSVWTTFEPTLQAMLDSVEIFE